MIPSNPLFQSCYPRIVVTRAGSQIRRGDISQDERQKQASRPKTNWKDKDFEPYQASLNGFGWPLSASVPFFTFRYTLKTFQYLVTVLHDLQVDLSTGFPVPLGYYRRDPSESRLRRTKQQREGTAIREERGELEPARQCKTPSSVIHSTLLLSELCLYHMAGVPRVPLSVTSCRAL